MHHSKRNISQTELLFHTNRQQFRNIFGPHLENLFQKYTDLRNFFYKHWLPFVKETKPLLMQLISAQHPTLAKITAPGIMEYINITTDNHCSHLVATLGRVCKEQRDNTDLKQKYPKLEAWRQFYCKPEKPRLLTDKQRNLLCFPDESEWEKHKAEENKKICAHHRLMEQRRKQYYDIVQPLLFKHLPALNELENDYWVIYAVALRDLYEEFIAVCEKLLDTVEYNMPTDSLYWKFDEWYKLLTERMKNTHRC